MTAPATAHTALDKLKEVWGGTTTGRTRIIDYLKHRGLPADVLDGVGDDVLRLHEALDYWDHNEAGDPVCVGTFPAIIAKVKDPEGNTVTIHRTYLDTEGPGKAPVEPAKKLMTATKDGATNGAAIRLFPAGSVLGLAEGIETALAVHAATGQAVWSCVSANGLEKVALPDGVQMVHLWADKDESGRGLQAAQAAAERFHAEGRIVYLHLPRTVDTDWRDVYNASGEGALLDELVKCSEWMPGSMAADAGNEDAPGAGVDSIEAELDRLARLDTVTYERERTEAAKALDMRASVLDAVVKGRRKSNGDNGGLFLAEPELWPDKVDGAALLDELAERVRRHVYLPSGAAETIALWIVHSHGHQAADVSPILAITSPTPECGKTTTLTVLQGTVRKPLPAANITAAALFRAVEKYEPTLLIDEADSFLRDNDELRGVLNSGHARAGAYVIRTIGDDHEPRHFRTWAPKAIALIGRLPPTLASRSVHVELKRLAPHEQVEPLRLHRLDELCPLQEKAARWVSDNLAALEAHDPEIPAGLYGRAADNWRALLAIADVAGGAWPQKAREVALSLSATRSEQTAGVLLLEDLRGLFDGKDRLTTEAIITALNSMDDRPWPEWSRGREMTARGLGKLLQPFGVTSRTIRLADGATAKGYHLEQLRDAFSRYLPPSESVTPSQPANRAENRPLVSVTSSDDVTDDDPSFSALQSQCDGVTDRNPPEGEEVPDESPVGTLGPTQKELI